MSDYRLIIFVKNPELGKVKTRLAASIGDQSALDIYRLLLAKTVEITENLEVDRRVFYTEYVEKEDMWRDDKYSKTVQYGNGLGEKMENAFREAFDQGFKRVCIIGSDCFDLSDSIVNNAFERLQENDFVVGPALDGGYYLLGMNQFHSELFRDKVYSTSSVMEELIEEVDKLGKSYSLLPTLSDIDTVDDLKKAGILQSN